MASRPKRFDARYWAGMQFRMPLGRIGLDEDHLGQERRTPPGTIGEITGVDWYPEQGWTYSVVFRNGAWLNYLEEEIDSGDLEPLFRDIGEYPPARDPYWTGQLPKRRYGLTFMYLVCEHLSVEAISPEDAIQESRTMVTGPRDGTLVQVEVNSAEDGERLLTEMVGEWPSEESVY